jgi:uncharacterized protein (TIGR02246 family)
MSNGQVRCQLAQGDHPMTDEQQIRDLVAKWMAETRAGNTPAVLDLMTEDVVFLRPGHPPMRKAEFAQGAKAQQAGKAPTFDGTSEIQESRSWASGRSCGRSWM